MSIDELKAHIGEETEITVYLTDVTQSANKSNIRWFDLSVCDATGVATFKIWMDTMTDDLHPEELVGCPVVVAGLIELWQGQGGMNVISIRKAEEGTYDMKDFFPSLDEKDEAYLISRLEILIGLVEDETLRSLLNVIFSESRRKKMAEKCGGTTHHMYLGGLLAHLIQTAEFAKAAADMYSVVGPYRKKVNTDNVIAGALLHDIGKLTTLAETPGKYTERGFNVDYATEGVLYITSYNNYMKSRVNDLAPIDHIILACRDAKPRSLEAIIVRNADIMSNKVDAYGLAFAGGSTKRGGTISYSREIGGYLLKGGE